MSSYKWTATDLPNLDGRTYVVTGANSGLGLITARELARAGGHVTLAVRDTAKGDRAAASIPGQTEVRELDLSDLSSVKDFAEGVDSVDVLINNAGLMAVPQSSTKDGFETQIGTNHLGHFALTNLLLEKLTDRVVTVSSTAHKMGKIRLDDLNWKRGGDYSPWPAYGQSKLANLLFTLELEKRLQAAGSKLHAYAAHPGYAATNLQNRTENVVQNTLMAVGNKVLAQSDAMGALPSLYAATQELPGASYIGPDGFQEQRGHPTLAGRTSRASDPETARKLWTLSAELTGIEFPLATAAA